MKKLKDIYFGYLAHCMYSPLKCGGQNFNIKKNRDDFNKAQKDLDKKQKIELMKYIKKYKKELKSIGII